MTKATTSTKKRLDLKVVLPAIDRKDLDYYNRLSDDDKKLYVPLVLMRCMSSLGPQNESAAYAVMITNEIVNKLLFQLGKHPELLHMLLCLTGTGKTQYRPYIGASSKTTSSKVIDDFLIGLYPTINETELNILKSQHNKDTLQKLGEDAGLSKAEIKELVEDAKKFYNKTTAV